MTNPLTQIAADLKPAAVDFCRRLIRVPALPGAEKGVADLYLAEMQQLGYDEAFRDDWGNVVGIIRGNRPGPTIMYNAHLDHVDPGDPAEWLGYDPYGAAVDIDEMENQDRSGTESAEVIHGRAAADVKGGGACQVYAGALLLKLREQGWDFPGTFMFTGVVLEETAEQLGMTGLIEETLPAHGLHYDGVVSCEATSLKLYLGHRGRVELQVTIEGVTSHGSAPWLGVNAVNKATAFIDRVEQVVAAQAIQDEELGRSSIALTVISCTPGALCIVPDRCQITYDRRLVPGESATSCLLQIQSIIDELSNQDPQFRAKVAVAAVPRTSYTGKTATLPNFKEPWKIAPSHPFVQAAATGLTSVGQPVKFGYWDFGTDLSVVCGRDKKPAIGYSPMQEFYCHRPIDKVRTDYMEKAIAGNAAVFLEMGRLPQEMFALK